MRCIRTLKEVQRLKGCLTTLKRFLLRAVEHQLLFSQALKNVKNLTWGEDCEQAFQELKAYLIWLSILATPYKGKEILKLYLTISNTAINAVIVINHGSKQELVYFISRTMQEAETRYPPLEKLSLALIFVVWHLRPYFQAHTIHVLSDANLKQIILKPEALVSLPNEP